MSRGIVSQKQFSRKKRRQTFKKNLNKAGVFIPEFKISQKLKKYLSRGLIFVLLIIFGTLILIKSLFFQPGQTISQVKFSEDTEATYKNPYLSEFITNETKGKNYFILLSNKDKLLSKIQKGFRIQNPITQEREEYKFPFVGDIEFQLETPQEEIIEENKDIIIGIRFQNLYLSGAQEQTGIQFIKSSFPLKLSKKIPDDGGILGIQLMYYEPTVLIQLNDKKYAVWNESTYVEMKEGMLLGIRDPDEEPLFLIETPQYLTGSNNLDGFFFEVNLTEFMQIISLAKNEFGNNMARFVYLAGSRRFAIFTNDEKTLYFNFPDGGNIEDQWNSQIFKYNTLREKYEKFGNIDKIDLGSLENNKTIIKNY